MASTFRIAWRRMAATTGFRTLYPAIIPPGSAHVNGIISAGPIDSIIRIFGGAVASSFLLDFFLRSSGVGDLYAPVFESIPFNANSRLANLAAKKYLRLNCLTSAYAPLWEEITGEEWTLDIPLRNAAERQGAQNDIDVLVALSLGVTADELGMIYRTQFPVMRRYDHENLYDANGRKVPGNIIKLHWKAKGEEILPLEQRTWQHPLSNAVYIYEYPFAPLDRETELRAAFDRFSQVEA